jgi:hypothetical protein
MNFPVHMSEKQKIREIATGSAPREQENTFYITLNQRQALSFGTV